MAADDDEARGDARLIHAPGRLPMARQGRWVLARRAAGPLLAVLWIRTRRIVGRLLAVLAVGVAAVAVAAAPSPSASGSDLAAAAADPEAATAPLLEVYVTEGCPHCASAKVWLAELARERPQLQIRLRVLDGDAQAQDELVERSLAAGVWPPGVPTFVLGDQVFVGFDPHATPRTLLEAIDHGRAAPIEVESAWFGALSANRLGLPLFTPALGLIDGFNACAMWVLLFLLSLLVRLNDRRRMALVAGTLCWPAARCTTR